MSNIQQAGSRRSSYTVAHDDCPGCAVTDETAGRTGQDTSESDPFAIDTSVAHPARIQNYLAGGDGHFAADRSAVEDFGSVLPGGLTDARRLGAFARLLHGAHGQLHDRRTGFASVLEHRRHRPDGEEGARGRAPGRPPTRASCTSATTRSCWPTRTRCATAPTTAPPSTCTPRSATPSSSSSSRPRRSTSTSRWRCCCSRRSTSCPTTRSRSGCWPTCSKPWCRQLRRHRPLQLRLQRRGHARGVGQAPRGARGGMGGAHPRRDRCGSSTGSTWSSPGWWRSTTGTRPTAHRSPTRPAPSPSSGASAASSDVPGSGVSSERDIQSPERIRLGDGADAPGAWRCGRRRGPSRRAPRRCAGRRAAAARRSSAGVRLKRGRRGRLDDAGDLDEGARAATLWGCCGASAMRQHRGEAHVGALHDRAPLVAGLRLEDGGEPLLQRRPLRAGPSATGRSARRRGPAPSSSSA